MKPFHATQSQVEQFQNDGYIMVEDLFTPREMELLLNIGRADQEKAKQVHAAKDTQGGESKLWLDSDTQRQDIYNGFCHSHRVVDTMAKLLRDEVYLYHYKMMVKEPKRGGAWEWHQDYGYWYNNNCLYPDMASCFIAVDRAYKGNGCLQVIKGSHKLGRVQHGKYGTQTGADPKRVELALKHLELVYCEMKPGTALFFHSNVLHRSDANTSDDPRWTFICCYNTKHNTCDDLPGHPVYRHLDVWDDSRIVELGEKQWAEMQKEMVAK
ncbi:MAG: phytanoyl-CoA dioxygenase family protein [Phycisphaera sp.]|nr:phytanoyl-CoA dioxygenase family protein [Phycisphaera sp.]